MPEFGVHPAALPLPDRPLLGPTDASPVMTACVGGVDHAVIVARGAIRPLQPLPDLIEQRCRQGALRFRVEFSDVASHAATLGRAWPKVSGRERRQPQSPITGIYGEPQVRAG